MSSGPSFSPFPYARLRQLTRRAAVLETQLARWLAVRPSGERLAALVGGPVHVALVGVGSEGHRDPHAARAEVRVEGLAIAVAGSAQPVRQLAQRLLGGPAELPAPRPLTVVEEALWALAVASALDDAGIAGEVWPLEGRVPADALHVELRGELGGAPITVVASVPPALAVRVPPGRAPHAWSLDLPVVLGRCALDRGALARLAVRDVIVVDRCCELVIGQGAVALTAAPGALEARVATEYVPRDMALPDDAHVELTVQLGTTRLTLRQLGELVPGQILQLGRPLAGPYEVRAAGRLVGQGELVDVDGELGVRIVSIADQE